MPLSHSPRTRTRLSSTAGVTLAAAVSVLLLVGALHATGILLTPSQMGMIVKPGETATETFRVAPSRVEKTQVRVRIVDFDKSPAGETVEGKTGDPERSCAGWVRVEPVAFETADSGWTDVRVSVTVPPGAKGSYWALAIFQAEAGAKEIAKGQMLAFRPQLFAPLVVTVAGTEQRRAKVENLKASLLPDGRIDVTADVTNTGNTALMPSGSWVVEHPAAGSGPGEELLEKELGSFLLLPAHSFKVRETLPRPGAPGTAGLAVRAYIRYGAEAGEVLETAVPVSAASAPGPAAVPEKKPAS